MSVKTKQTKKPTSFGGDWKNLLHGFVGNMLDQLSENVSQKVQAWLKIVKRKTIGFFLILLGLVYFLSGVAMFFNAFFAKIAPGLGFVIVGVLILLIGVLMNKDETK
jgi:surface polysaccharide O-acyltransferase-like enzyme